MSKLSYVRMRRNMTKVEVVMDGGYPVVLASYIIASYSLASSSPKYLANSNIANIPASASASAL